MLSLSVIKILGSDRSMKEIIRLKNVVKKYNEVEVVHLSKLHLYQGEIYGLLGLNGAGKTTTMKMILSLIQPTAGKISVLGRELSDQSKDYLNKIGSVIEEPSYYPNLTAYENLAIFQKILKFDKKNIMETLNLVGLNTTANQKKLVKNYSLGMKQRLALAFALVKKPEILILDEPTNGLDPQGIQEIRELIVQLAKKEGLTVLVSSHILSEIEQMADRVGIIHHGKMLYEGKIEDIQTNRWIEIRGDFSNRESIAELVTRENIEIYKHTSTTLQIENIENNRITSLLKLLVHNNILFYEVVRKRESLENIFLSLTRGDI